MTLPGYSFTRNEIHNLINNGIEMITIDWGIQSAQRMNAYIQVGYPRILTELGEQLFNSVSLISPTGEIIYTYDKHFLYCADEVWATPGEGFKSFDLPFGTVGPGICMDVNPWKFEAPFDAFEFANFHALKGTRWLFLSMAWIKSSDHTPISLIYYWIRRLSPLIDVSAECDDAHIVLISNRNGTEDETTYAGSSCILKFFRGQVTVMGHMNSNDEGVLIVNLDSK